MTQVKEMTNPELNRKLAELMGYTVHQENCYFYQLVNGAGEPVVGWYAQNPDDAWNMVPDYCTDPAASLEVQAKCLQECPAEYIHELQEVMWGHAYGDMPFYRIAQLLQATPRERAEAAYKTLSSK